MMSDIYQELPLDDALVKRGVTKMVKQGNFSEGYTVLIMVNDKPILFDVHNTKNGKWKKTLENYTVASMGLGLSDEFKAMIATQLMNNSEMILGYDHRESIKYEESETLDESIKSMSVTEAAHTHSGSVLINGMIVTRSRLYQLVKKAKWRCYSCNELLERDVSNILEPPTRPKECPACGGKELEDKHDLINTVSLGLQEEEIQEQDNVLDDLDVRVFNGDTIGIQVGEVAKIIGDIKSKQDPRTKQYHSVILVKSIQYEHRKKLVLTSADIKGIKKFVFGFPNYERRLKSMFAPNVIGHDHAKFALLISTIGAPETFNREGKTTRGRIHSLLIGPPGLAKTMLGKEVKQLRINSRYASGKRTTGKSLTAMVIRENDNEVLRLGPAAHAKGAILLINEFDKLPGEDQDNLLEVMDEGMIDMTTFAKEFHIPADTTIIASANPVNNRWMDSDKNGKIDLKEIPFSSIMLSRFDIIIAFRDTLTEQEDRNYADAKVEYDECRIKHNYNFLRKLIEYIKTIDPVLTQQARGILNEFYVLIRQKHDFASSPRTLDTIYRIARAFARMSLSPVVDDKIAIRTIDFMNDMLVQFHSAIFLVPDPFMKAYEETIIVIRNQKKTPIALIEAVKMATERSEQVKSYIGKIFEQNRNKKLRNLCSKILEDKHIMRIQEHPTVVIWSDSDSGQGHNDDSDSSSSDLRDPSDPGNPSMSQKIKNPSTKTDEKVEKITRNDTQNVPEKKISDMPKGNDESPRAPGALDYEKDVKRQKERFNAELKGHDKGHEDRVKEIEVKKHDIYWSGTRYYCHNCKEHGDKPHMTEETNCFPTFPTAARNATGTDFNERNGGLNVSKGDKK